MPLKPNTSSSPDVLVEMGFVRPTFPFPSPKLPLSHLVTPTGKRETAAGAGRAMNA